MCVRVCVCICEEPRVEPYVKVMVVPGSLVRRSWGGRPSLFSLLHQHDIRTFKHVTRESNLDSVSGATLPELPLVKRNVDGPGLVTYWRKGLMDDPCDTTHTRRLDIVPVLRRGRVGGPHGSPREEREGPRGPSLCRVRRGRRGVRSGTDSDRNRDRDRVERETSRKRHRPDLVCSRNPSPTFTYPCPFP